MSDTETVARILCRGYNEHVKAHGPDTDGARAERDALTVIKDGVIYEVTIVPSGIWRGGGYEMRRACGHLNCTDPEHLVVQEG
jgi:hypothetical protein